MGKKTSYQKSISIKGAYPDLALLWILRLYSNGIANAKETRGLLKNIFGENVEPENINEFRVFIKSQLEILEKCAPILDGVVAKNLDLLSKHFGLNKVEKLIFAFRTIYRINTSIETVMDEAISGLWTDYRVYQVLSVALKLPITQIEKALKQDGRLIASGLLNNPVNMGRDFGSKLNVMNSIVSALNRAASTIDELLEHAIDRIGPKQLSMACFPHHRDDIDLIVRHLRGAIKNGAKGVNILIHGIPGVGKTELVKVMVSNLKLNAFEVILPNESSDSDDDIHPRFRVYCMLQQLLSKTKKGLVVFDEIEDVLPKQTFINSKSLSKVWFNKILETNPVPTVWISNHVLQIDPAYMRRFDIVLEVRTPPRSVRKNILKDKMAEFKVDEKWLEEKANDVTITPAIADRIVKVIKSSEIMTSEQVQLTFDRLMCEHRNALGELSSGKYPMPNQYHLDWLNTTSDMQAISQGLKRISKGRVLLYGPPGCGKTAFAHHLALTMDKPLLLKRASDILSSWLGETERNLQQMFQEAAREDAILLLDEADSFLQDRRGFNHSWEITQVNELLTQMENFQGIFICATNFMEHLDTAAMRRFAIKIKFDFLKPEQVESIFMETLQKTGDEKLDDIARQKIRKHLGTMKNLTPGDFSALSDHFDLLGKSANTENMLLELNQACEMKGGNHKIAIGFVA